MYLTPPVSSNMMTTSDTVMRVTPPRTAAAPTIAYRPGVIHDEDRVPLAHSPEMQMFLVEFTEHKLKLQRHSLNSG